MAAASEAQGAAVGSALRDGFDQLSNQFDAVAEQAGAAGEGIAEFVESLRENAGKFAVISLVVIGGAMWLRSK